jgi:hypothetical protein
VTLAMTVLAAVAFTVAWYSGRGEGMLLSLPCLMYWGASLMWLVDAVVEYLSEGIAIFNPSGGQLANDAFLGLCVVTLGLVVLPRAVRRDARPGGLGCRAAGEGPARSRPRGDSPPPLGGVRGSAMGGC